MKALPGNPYDGHTLQTVIPDMRSLVGNTVDSGAALELMETGIHGVLVGVGPGAACTSREVLGIGIPQVTATIDTAYARDVYYERTGRYVPIITDGGIRTGGDVSKAICASCKWSAVIMASPPAAPAISSACR